MSLSSGDVIISKFNNTDFIITDIVMATRVKSTPEDKIRVFDSRKFHGLVFWLSGEGHFCFSDKILINDENSILFLRQGCCYTVPPNKNGLGECIAVNFHTLNDLDLDNVGFHFENYELFKDLFVQIEKEWLLKQHSYSIKCKAILYEIIALIAASLNKEYMPNQSLEKLKKAHSYIIDNYPDSTLNIDSLAKISNISTVYFRQLFTKVYKTTPNKYINKIRINRAKDLLSSGYPTIGEVALLTGFSDIFYFSRIFKKETGLSPSEFKKRK